MKKSSIITTAQKALKTLEKSVNDIADSDKKPSEKELKALRQLKDMLTELRLKCEAKLQSIVEQ